MGRYGSMLAVLSVLKELCECHGMVGEIQSSLTWMGILCHPPSYWVTFEKLHNLSECHLLNYKREF